MSGHVGPRIDAFGHPVRKSRSGRDEFSHVDGESADGVESQRGGAATCRPCDQSSARAPRVVASPSAPRALGHGAVNQVGMRARPPRARRSARRRGQQTPPGSGLAARGVFHDRPHARPGGPRIIDRVGAVSHRRIPSLIGVDLTTPIRPWARSNRSTPTGRSTGRRASWSMMFAQNAGKSAGERLEIRFPSITTS